ncbi:MAG: PH domain-containing protein [Anaerolineae bacterium]|jgi:hypothetical protein|nr:PH domain-containing protein [Anaerolineae bacterium]
MDQTLIFKPRPSSGWLWVGGLGVLMLALGITPTLGGISLSETWFPLVISGGLGLFFIALAAWFPTLRYELDDEALTLRYGPILHYRIPLQEIKEMRRRNLQITLWSSMRMPGLALFTVPYADAGNVKMCASACATRILLIDTEHGPYGITPADEETFVAAVKERMER